MSFDGLSKTFASRRRNAGFYLHPVALLITLLAIAAMVKLGFWQIDRGQEKQAIVDYHATSSAQQTQSLTLEHIRQQSLQTDDQIEITGSFQDGAYFLVDNQTYNGRVGYHVVALLENEALAPYLVPVNLGWVPLGGPRDTLPEVELPQGTRTVSGRIQLPAERPFLLAEQEFSAQLPQRVQYLELDSIRAQTQLPLASFSILLNENIDFGFRRDWPVVVMEPHRHYAYAAQWFGLAIAALVIFLIANKRLARRPPQPLQQQHTSEDSGKNNKNGSGEHKP
ncbi:SURF1 family protein [Aliidiomarina soli]|uniref:SURF1-like protein n=1 Tax=Aliidiomarina soli TaxID=1928574 RepID=A0A432WJQ5_9GAMM|nr:SURF1 family protein [Aliidiomarina soli]RUO33919.1 hypothetical protein CWE14_05550 [Aliidiomarina soli]